MKDLVNQWFEQSVPFEGILACGVRFPDQSSVSKTWADGFEESAVENALRCVIDGFQIVQMNRINPARLRWVYSGAFLYCERRPDGTCLGVFTAKNIESISLNELERFFTEFQAVARGASL
jgi:hypothetical protein